MSGNGAAVLVAAALLLTACAGPQRQPPGTSPAPVAGACGIEASIPDDATLRAEDVWPAGGATTAGYTVLPATRCSSVARRPERCDSFPWTTEQDLYALGGRGWLSVRLGTLVREQAVLYAADSSFAYTYARAAADCGFATLTVVDGDPVTLQRTLPGVVEVVYLTPRAVIWMSSADPAVGVDELVRLASIAAERSEALTVP